MLGARVSFANLGVLRPSCCHACLAPPWQAMLLQLVLGLEEWPQEDGSEQIRSFVPQAPGPCKLRSLSVAVIARVVVMHS